MFEGGRLRVSVVEACCDALYSLGCNKEAANGFYLITGQLENALGNHEHTAQSYHSLGLAQKELKEYKTAFCSFKKAFDIRRKILQKTPEKLRCSNLVRKTINSLSCCCLVLENFDATTADTNNIKVACEELEGVIINEQDFAVDCFAELACIYNNAGSYYFGRNDYNESLMLLQRAIEIKEENLGDHVDTLPSLHNVGTVYLHMNRYIEAGKSFHRALDLRKRLGIEDHEDTAITYHLIGKNHFERGEYNKALKAQLHGLRLREKHLGDHHLTATSFHESGWCYYKMGKYEEARKQFQNAVELRKMLLGNHADTALSFHYLSETYFEMGNYPAALDACSRALNIRLELLPEHVDTATSLHLQGSIHSKIGDFKAAVRSFRRASNLRSKQLGDLHRDTVLSYHCLGEAQFALQDFSGAVESLLTASTLRNEMLGFHSDTAATVELLGRAYEALGWHDLASQQIKQALEIREHCANAAFCDPSDPLSGLY